MLEFPAPILAQLSTSVTDEQIRLIIIALLVVAALLAAATVWYFIHTSPRRRAKAAAERRRQREAENETAGERPTTVEAGVGEVEEEDDWTRLTSPTGQETRRSDG